LYTQTECEQPGTLKPLGTRATTRWIDPGSFLVCSHCRQIVRFRPRQTCLQVIVNVYVDDRWARVEHFHAECYDAAGMPFGAPVPLPSARPPRRGAAAR
jgi:hypothetical protein